MKKTLILFLVALSSLAVSCSGRKVTAKREIPNFVELPSRNIKTSMVNLQISKLYPWLNLMPGNARRTFNITGDITVLPGASYNFQTLKLKLIKIYQKGVFLYLINPTVRQTGTGEKGNLKKILFSTIKGVELIPFQKTNQNITVELIFDSNGKILSYTIPDIKVEKAY